MKSKPMRAFHGDPKIKVKYLKRLKAHAKADEIVRGVYWEDGKGCAVGCSIEGNKIKGSYHKAFEKELGVPETIAYLEDRIFEGLPNAEAKKWPIQFLEAIKPGADLSLVTPKFMVWMLADKKDGVIKYANNDYCKKAIQDVADLYQRIIDGGTVSDYEWNKAVWAAEAMAARAAVWAAMAAMAAVWAAEAMAAMATTEAAYKKMATKLLKLLKEAPVVKK